MTDPRSDNWKYMDYPDHSPALHAQELAKRIHERGMDLSAGPDTTCLRFEDLVQVFADAADDVVDEHIRNARGKANDVDAHASTSEAPKEAQETPHRCARAMMIVHNDNSQTMMFFDHPWTKRGWKFSNINGVPMLVVGHGVPRRHFPLSNVKFMDLLTEDDL